MVEALAEVLVAIGEEESQCAEQEAMFREVLHSLLARTEGEDWLPGNVEALGNSHREYGVEPFMFDGFVESIVGGVRERLPDVADDAHVAALEVGVRAITAPMRAAVAAG